MEFCQLRNSRGQVVLEKREMYKTVFEYSIGQVFFCVFFNCNRLVPFIKTDTLESVQNCIWLLCQAVGGCFLVTDLWIFLQIDILESNAWSLITAWNVVKLSSFRRRKKRDQGIAGSQPSVWNVSNVEEEKVYILLRIHAVNSSSCACVWIQTAATRRATPTRLSCMARPRRRRHCTLWQRLMTPAATELTTRAWTTSLMSTTETMR